MRFSKITGLLFALCLSASAQAHAAEKYAIAWSHYTGWEPWGYIEDSGLMDKWAKKYGIDVEVKLVNDYIESINLYTAGEFQGVAVTNMDALTIPAVGGVDSSAIIVGDYSNGNDAIVAQDVDSVTGMKGREVKLVELSVSHYLLARALEENGMTERDIKTVNTSDADIGGLFMSDPKALVVTWNPIVNEIREKPGAKILFDSSKIPGEILDLMVVRTDTPDTLKKALTGAWYEAMAIMNGKEGPEEQAKALDFMAKQAGGTRDQFDSQLKTTEMYYSPADAVAYATPEKLHATMDEVRKFSFERGLFGDGVESVDAVGIAMPDGKVLGSEKNVKLRFDNSYMAMAAEGSM